MGMKISRNEDEDDFSSSNIDFMADLTHKLDLSQRESITFPSPEISAINVDKTFNTNISITEELNKSTKSTKMDSIFDNKFELVPFKFEWRENESNSKKELEVIITGSFLNNWEQCIKMEKNPETNIYEYYTTLPKEKHFFKYIINNRWLCSDLYPTTKDESNNINNFIDLTNYNISSTEKNILTVENIENEKPKKKNKKNKKFEKKINDGGGYGLKFPLNKDLNVTAPVVMLHYKEKLLLDNQSNQSKFGNINELNLEYNNNTCYNENNSYKNIFIFPHEKLGHITPNIDDIFSDKNYNRYSITERKKHKYLTFVYYKPKQVK